MTIKRVTMLGFVLLSGVLSALAYPRLPAMVASHWGVNGEANGYMPRFWGVAFVPILMLVLYAVYVGVQYLDPKQENIKAMRGQIDTFGVAFMAFLTYVHGMTLAWNLGYHFDFGRWLMPAIAVLFFAIGDLITNAKQNWFFGIRTPWTLSDERVWEDTHKVGGMAFKLISLPILLGIFFPSTAIILLLVLTITASVAIVVYSYVRYRALHRKA